MANLASIARPYALGAFEYAENKQDLPAWKAFLENAALIAALPIVLRLIANPELPPVKLGDFFQDLLSPHLNAERKNFLLLLSQHKRFNVLPDIAELFNTYVAALEKTSTVRVITAITAHEDFKKKLAEVLSKQIQRAVLLECIVDPSIIGGAIIHIGDKVIDGSIQGKLTRLFESLTD